jgi:hypothetical protein
MFLKESETCREPVEVILSQKMLTELFQPDTIAGQACAVWR